MARIGIDATSVSAQGKGLARYQKNITQALAGLGLDHDFFVFSGQPNLGEVLEIDSPRFHFIHTSFHSSFIWDQVQFPQWISRYQLDLIHTAYDRLSFFSGVPAVVYLFETPAFRTTLHRTLNRPQNWHERISYFYNTAAFPFSMEKAALILTSSEFTRQELEREFESGPALTGKIKVVYPAHDASFQPLSNPGAKSEIQKKVSGGAPYFLHFSTGDLRDNTSAVLRAFEAAKKRLPPGLKLVIAGMPRTEHDLKNGNGILTSSVIHHPFATGEDLVRLYQGAEAYLDPSLYEGFGFQFLEAMACGTPVIGSDVTSIPEVVGDAGILVSLKYPDQLAEAMIRVMSGASFRTELIQKGLNRASQFSWKRTAGEVAEGFEGVLQHAC